MIEAATPTMQHEQQMATIKRGRGRPRKAWDDQSGYIRGPRNMIIQRFQNACRDNGIDASRDLERLMEERADELESDEKFEETMEQVEALARLEILKRREQRKTRLGGIVQKYKENDPEVMAAIAEEVQRLRAPEYRASLHAVLEDAAKNLAKDFPGVHWGNIKIALKKGATGKGPT